MNNIYGYIRVSSVDQNEARQLAAMQRLRVHEKHIYLDKQSGKDFERPNYQKLIGKMQQGILAAKAKGVCFGRPEASIPKNFNKLVLPCHLLPPSERPGSRRIEVSAFKKG